MTATALDPQAAAAIDAVVATAYYGKPGATKRGRNPRWPYVPVLTHRRRDDGVDLGDSQILGLAYATRAEAVAAAEAHINRLHEHLARDLARPECRALREWWGLPRELSEVGR